MSDKFYISGQISGLVREEAERFFEQAEEELKGMKLLVCNPMKLPHLHSKTWEEFMCEDIRAIFDCEGIYMLENWGTSRGARIEYAIARELGLRVIFQKEARQFHAPQTPKLSLADQVWAQHNPKVGFIPAKDL